MSTCFLILCLWMIISVRMHSSFPVHLVPYSLDINTGNDIRHVGTWLENWSRMDHRRPKLAGGLNLLLLW